MFIQLAIKISTKLMKKFNGGFQGHVKITNFKFYNNFQAYMLKEIL